MIQPPALRQVSGEVEIAGDWTLASLMPHLPALQVALEVAAKSGNSWNLSALGRLDSAAAALLWRAWGESWPAVLTISESHRYILQRTAATPFLATEPVSQTRFWFDLPLKLLRKGMRNLRGLLSLLGQFVLDIGYLIQHPAETPWREISANVYKAGALALPVAALVGFLIGITISYLSALQLKSFGADIFIVNILGIAIIRELGPVLVAVLVAGRSGSAMTSQIGVMRVTEEIDALHTMGISRSLRIVLPKIIGLTAAMPLLVLWTSAVALFGGMVAAMLQLDLSFAYFLDNLPRAVPVSNLLIGLSKGLLFGFVIALVACYFGLRVRPNTESLSANTTSAVVTAITTVILVDAVFAVLTRQIGVPSL